MKKIINMNLAILLAFVLASGIFSISGSVYAQSNDDDDDNNNNSNENDDANNGNIDVTVNPLTGTNVTEEDVSANFTEFVNSTTPEDVSEQVANITGSSAPPGELDYASGDNITSTNSTNPTTTTNSTNTTTVQ